MSSRLSDEAIQRLTPLLASLARLVAGGSQLGEGELQTLLLGADLETDPTMLAELKRWVLLLKALRVQPTPEIRVATKEALTLRGLPEAAVLLAVDTVASGGAKPTPTSTAASARAIWASVTNLDFGTLAPGQAARGEFEVRGGPGQVVTESTQVSVSPQQFGAGITRVRVEARPISGGLLWTTLKLVTASETLQIPLLAQWAASSASSPGQAGAAPPISQPDLDLAAMIDQAINTSAPPAGNRGGNNQQPTQSGEQEILEQLRRLLG